MHEIIIDAKTFKSITEKNKRVITIFSENRRFNLNQRIILICNRTAVRLTCSIYKIVRINDKNTIEFNLIGS